jgi:hypothetical protein
MNQLVDSLVVSASMFIPPMPPRLVYEVQMKYRPSLPDNVTIGKFLKMMMNLIGFFKSLMSFLKCKLTSKMKP